MNRLHWVSTSGRLNVGNLGYRPVEGGHETDGTAIYIARGPYKDATHPGKASEKLDGESKSSCQYRVVDLFIFSGAYVTYGGKERVVKVSLFSLSLSLVLN
jgi:hypothetical protein